MDGLFGLIIVGSIVSTLLGLLFWGGVAWLGVKAMKSVQESAGSGPGRFGGLAGVTPDFLQQMQALVAQAQAAQSQFGNAPSFVVPAHLQQRFDAQMMRAQRELRDMDRLHKEKHETTVAGMLSDASTAGIDVSGWRF